MLGGAKNLITKVRRSRGYSFVFKMLIYMNPYFGKKKKKNRAKKPQKF